MPRPLLLLISALLPLFASLAPAFDLVEALPLTERIVMVHVKEGHAVHHQRGEQRSDHEAVILTPLDVAAATAVGNWTIGAAGDPAFAAGVHPLRVGRKSKGTDFAWMVEWSQAENRAVNSKPDHAKDHWLYLLLPGSLGATVIYFLLVRDWGPGRTGTYAFVSPVLGVVLAMLLFGERIDVADVLGMTLMLGAAGLALRH